MANKAIRIVLDTNIWISYLISNRFLHIDKLLKDESIVLIFSEELLFEFLDVVERPKMRKFFTRKDVKELLTTMDQVGVMVDVRSKVSKCRDEKDNFLLALCKDGKADYLVSGDEDLLSIKKFGKTKIIKYAQLKKEIK